MDSEYILSPLNFTGGKYKLLPQILPLFPEKINTFVDIFLWRLQCWSKCKRQEYNLQ